MKIKFLLTFFGDSLHANSISSKWRIWCSRFLRDHFRRVFPLGPIVLHSRQMIVYLIRTIIRCTSRARHSKLIGIHVHWPVDTILERTCDYIVTKMFDNNTVSDYTNHRANRKLSVNKTKLWEFFYDDFELNGWEEDMSVAYSCFFTKLPIHCCYSTQRKVINNSSLSSMSH